MIGPSRSASPAASPRVRRPLRAPLLVAWLLVSMIVGQAAGWWHEVSHGIGPVPLQAAAGDGVAIASVEAGSTSNPTSTPTPQPAAHHYCQLVHAGTLAAFLTSTPTVAPSLEVRRVPVGSSVAAEPGQPSRPVFRSHAPPSLPV